MSRPAEANKYTVTSAGSDNARKTVYIDIYLPVVRALNQIELPFLVGGAYAFEYLTGIERELKDFDIFVRQKDCSKALDELGKIGYKTDLTFPHWLAKATCGEHYIDIIFNSGNGIARVDDEWFAHAIMGDFLGVPICLCPAEETIWSKAFVMERERYDGADVAHLLLARGKELNWRRLIGRFDAHWRLLLSHLILFRFIYPYEHAQIPAWVIDELMQKWQEEASLPESLKRICQGTLVSREQYLPDLQRGYQDARLIPKGNMTPSETKRWTDAISNDE